MLWVREQKVNGRWVRIDSCPLTWLFGRLTLYDMLRWWPSEDNIRIRKELHE